MYLTKRLNKIPNTLQNQTKLLQNYFPKQKKILRYYNRYLTSKIPYSTKNLLKNHILHKFSSKTNKQTQKINQDEYSDLNHEPEPFSLKNPSSTPKSSPFNQVLIQDDQTKINSEFLYEILSKDPSFDIKKFFFALQYFEKDKGDDLTIEQAEVICWNFYHSIYTNKALEQKINNREPRNPVVTIMGHVDHGKTTLLDNYRNSRITEAEHGGITQKIGGFIVKTDFGEISFIDTPGHQLFKNMRETGALSTDLVILVVSAIEGIQPQVNFYIKKTKEIFDILKSNQIPFVIAINKIDVEKADPEYVEISLNEYGIELEIFGGNIPVKAALTKDCPHKRSRRYKY